MARKYNPNAIRFTASVESTLVYVNGHPVYGAYNFTSRDDAKSPHGYVMVFAWEVYTYADTKTGGLRDQIVLGQGDAKTRDAAKASIRRAIQKHEKSAAVTAPAPSEVHP